MPQDEKKETEPFLIEQKLVKGDKMLTKMDER